ncbi:hypothetical protein DUI87_05013 [Hirundo rustica rustica]|uniref:Macrophage immunometabolism regulator n=1 Tax=Hirundo rustica rustica TaxID=333673 RepID=A0A3M0KYA9_HIRRU|nr:hypothetical protein DUI87_05013 [Hirundo rustica rustica]
MEVDVNGESRTAFSTLPVPLAEVSSAARMEAEKPRCSSTPCSPLRRTVAGYQILHMDSNYLVGFTTGEELLKLAHKCTGSEENKGESGLNLGSKHLDSGLPRSSRLYKTRSRYYQPYEIPAVNGRRRRRMPSSGDKYNKALPYEPYKGLHGPLPLCLLKEAPDPYLDTASSLVIVESNKVLLKHPFLQAKPLSSVSCSSTPSSLDSVQHLTFLFVRGPKLNTEFEVQLIF